MARRGLAALAAGAVLVGPLLGVPSPANGAGDEGIAGTRIIVLVDESGSLGASGAAQERDAGALVVDSEFSGGSEVAFVGFGSAEPPHPAAVVYCDFIRLQSAASRQQARDCAGRPRLRPPGEGVGTDFASAMRTAFDVLDRGRPPGAADAPSVLLLLTDGVLSLGSSADNAAAQRTIDTKLLPEARRRGVAIWPLGFGDADPAALTAFAEGGAAGDTRCSDVTGTKPRARVVADLGDVNDAMVEALALARCAHAEAPSRDELSAGQTVRLKVEIPPIATDGSIAVSKIDPRVVVSYTDPRGRVVPASGDLDGQQFERFGGDRAVESLRVVNPVPGAWTVTLQAPLDLVGRARVSATAVWTGAVRSVLEAVPAEPAPGEPVAIRVHLVSRSGAIIDPTELAGLSFRAGVEGTGFEPVAVTLADDGIAPDRTAADGVLGGLFVVPSGATGEIRVSSTVQGAGVGDTRTFALRVRTPSATGPPTTTTAPVEASRPVRRSSKLWTGLLLGGLVLAVGAAATMVVARRRSRKRASRALGLQAELWRDGQRLSAVPAEGGGSRVLRVRVETDPARGPGLVVATPEDRDVISITRARSDGHVELSGRQVERKVAMGDRVDAGHGCLLVVTDSAPRRGRSVRPAPPRDHDAGHDGSAPADALL